MKILLLGEYSNVHATLADGLRKLGHQVTVLSNGDFWKIIHETSTWYENQGKGRYYLFSQVADGLAQTARIRHCATHQSNVLRIEG